MLVWIIGLTISALGSILGFTFVVNKKDKEDKSRKIEPVKINTQDLEKVDTQSSVKPGVAIAGGVAAVAGTAAGGYYLYKRNQTKKTESEPFGRFKDFEKRAEKKIEKTQKDIEKRVKKSKFKNPFRKKTLFEKIKDRVGLK